MKCLRLNTVFLLAFPLILTVSCNKKLDQSNPNAQTSSSFWKTGTDALQGINAAYAPLLLDGAYMRFTPVLLDVRGDDVKSNSPWTAISGVGKFAIGTADAAGYGWAFDEYYEGVFRSNQVLDNVPAISMDADLKKRILGQAYFMRGLYFFHLVDLFGNVALPTTAPKNPSQFFIHQSTQDEGWKQIISDFKNAADMLPVSYSGISGPDAGQLGRATRGAALAYLGKTYLFNKMYTEAAAQFKAVIDLGVYDLMPDYRDNFTETAENNKESIFEVQFSTNVGGTDLGWQGIPSSTWGKYSARAITFAAPGFGWRDVQPTRSVFDEFHLEKTVDGKVDPRILSTIFYNDTIDTHLATTPMYQTTFQQAYKNDPAALNDLFCKKYENGYGNKPNEFDWKSGINERLMRYADVLLMYAECLNELGQTSQAAPYIQKVRTRANLPDITAVMAAMSKQQMRDQLAHERLLEFCLEGHRFDDIRRWGWLQDATKLALLKARDPEFNNYQPGKELYPIPQGEIDNNPGFKQNPTY